MAEARVTETKTRNPLKVFGQPKMAALLVLGFSSGLPLYLTGQGKALQAWMTTAHVDLTTIGFFSLVGLPFSLKFLWAPILDRYIPPFLGRRRGWLVITQILLLIAIGAMALHDPVTGLRALAINAILIAFFSASQDIVGDAYRTDVLSEREMGAGASVWVLGYRLAMLLVGSAALVLADRLTWPTVYLILSGFMLIGIIASILAPEPVLHDAPPKNLGQAVYLPFREFFTRSGLFRGLLVLFFIILYKYSDSLAGSMTTPFLLKVGFTQKEIGVVLGGAGLIAIIAGSIAGGAVIARMGINKPLWLFAIIQALSNLTYYGLSLAGRDHAYMVFAIVIENFGLGLVSASLTAYLMTMCNKRFSATQFALLSSLMAASRDILVSPGGKLAESYGWPTFFLITVLAGIPCLLLLPFIAPWRAELPNGAAEHEGDTTTAKRAA
ncbi:MAG TPA: AmpG family muropeptide MFS transporter [Gemmatimonadaceae bacterium]|nr:AmpG family muropeptide MFS transporter [Gemmatimonadaceae bacterium]